MGDSCWNHCSCSNIENTNFFAIKKNEKECYWAKYGANEKQKGVHAAKAISCSLRHMENDHYDVILTAGGSLPIASATVNSTIIIQYISFCISYFMLQS